jgi:hypothetical protein
MTCCSCGDAIEGEPGRLPAVRRWPEEYPLCEDCYWENRNYRKNFGLDLVTNQTEETEDEESV